MRNNRKNNRGGRSVKDNKSSFKFIPIVLVVAVLGYAIYRLIPDPIPVNLAIESVFPVKAEEPIAATVYLDNSASMEGYVHGSDYIDALADLMSIYPKTHAECINSNISIDNGADLITRLKKGEIPYVGQSLLNEDMAKIIEKVAGNKDVAKKKGASIAFFVTDGIMCGADADVLEAKKKGQKYNIDHRQDLMNAISKVFCNKKVGVSVYRLVSDFKGKYYCYDNDHDSINARRSFYIIAIGKPSVVAHFKERLAQRQRQAIFKLRQEDEIHFIDYKAINQCVSVNAGDGTSLIVDTNNVVTFDAQKIKQDTKINIFIANEAFKNYISKSFGYSQLAKNLRVEIDGTCYQKIAAEEDTQHHAIKVQLDPRILNAGSAGSYVRLYISYFTPQWINDINNDDDKYMLTINADERTFLFSYFINGIKNNGILPEKELYIYDRKLLFKKK